MSADTDTNWRRGLAKPEPPPPKPKPKASPAPPSPPRYSAPPAPWANAPQPARRPVDDAAFPTLAAADDEPEEESAGVVRSVAQRSVAQRSVRALQTTAQTVVSPPPSSPRARGAKNPWGVAPKQPAADPSWPSLARAVASSASASSPTTTTPKEEPSTTSKKEQPSTTTTTTKSLKPKPQKSYSIMDAVVVRKAASSSEKKPSSEKPQMKKTAHTKVPASPVRALPPQEKQHTLAELEGPGVEAKKAPKKRKLSSLKKRVLLERLEMRKELLKTTTTTKGEGEKEDVRVRLVNAARVSEVEDDDEREEVLGDVRDMCVSLGATPTSIGVVEETQSGDFAVIEASFEDKAAAMAVVDGLRGRLLGGERLGLEVVVAKKKTKKTTTGGGGVGKETAEDSSSSSSEEVVVQRCFFPGAPGDDVTTMLVRAQEIRLAGVVSKEDRVRIDEDPDELDEIVEDLRELVESKCGLCVVAVDVVQATGDAVVSLETEDREKADGAVAILRGVSLGGENLKASLNRRAQLVLRKVCDEAALEDDEEVQETESDLANVCRRKFEDLNEGFRGDFVNAVAVVSREALGLSSGVAVGDAILETKLDADLALGALKGLVLGGAEIEVAVLAAGDAPSSLFFFWDDDEDEGSLQDKKKEPLLIRAKKTGKVVQIPAKYAEAYASRHKPPQASYPRTYATKSHPLDLELDDAVASLLGKLVEFQDRLKNDPLKFKMRRRLVLGLREVRRGVKADNVKLLILAPNMDESKHLDDSVKDLVALAHDNDVPVVFALTKKKLGRTLRKPVGVSAVGVYSADGANDDFRTVIKRRDAIVRDPSTAKHPRDSGGSSSRKKKKNQNKVITEASEDVVTADTPTKRPTTTTLRQQQHQKGRRGPSDDDSSFVADEGPGESSPADDDTARSPRSSSVLTATAPAWTAAPSSALSAATPVFFPTTTLSPPPPPPPPPEIQASILATEGGPVSGAPPPVMLAPPLLYAYGYWPGSVS